MDSTLTIIQDGDDWQVWIALLPGEPRNQRESFIIGTGASRDAAVADAVRELEACVETLQAPDAIPELPRSFKLPMVKP